MPAVVYGTPAQVASFATVWTRNGVWVDPVPASPPNPAISGTNPTLTEVNQWLADVTAMMNLALGNRNFTYPINSTTSPNAFAAVSSYVAQLVADLCHYKNSRGRFITDRVIEKNLNPMAIIARDIDLWVGANERGLLEDGVEQNIVPLARNFPHMRVLGRFGNRNGSARSIEDAL